MKKIALIQSDYIPWKGYFDIINSVDEFFFHDDLQYTKNDWRNRNLIKTDKGPVWITIPCGTNEKRLICEVEMKDNKWQKVHWQQIERFYNNAKYWDLYRDYFEEVYLKHQWRFLSDLNQTLIINISVNILGIKTRFRDSREFELVGSKGERVLELIKKAEATSYLSGPLAKNYLDLNRFKESGIKVIWMDYSGYPEYEQQYPPFEHRVSIIDLIFNEGPEAFKFMKSFINAPGKI
jgi:hypothetical protein